MGYRRSVSVLSRMSHSEREYDLIAAIARHGNREWVTGIDALQTAEDRIHQLAVANRIGIATPPTIVSSDPTEIDADSRRATP